VGRSPAVLFLFAALSASLGAGSARAHDVWLEPSTHRPAPNQRIDIRLRVGERFRGETAPRRPERIERFVALGPSGEREIVGVAGVDPAGVARLDREGTWLLVYDNLPARIELPAERFESYLVEEGLERVVESRRERGASKRPGRERYSRSVKCLVTVGSGEAAGFDRTAGLELELVPERDPRALTAPAELPFRLLFRGEPLAGALVRALPRRAPERASAARTDRDGRVALPIAPGDVWLVRTVHMIEAAEGDPEVDWESYWAALSFEVPRDN